MLNRRFIRVVYTIYTLKILGADWLRRNRYCLISFKQDVYIGHAYLPPASSNVLNFEDVDVFELIEQDLLKYTDLGKTYFCGDLNSRS